MLTSQGLRTGLKRRARIGIYLILAGFVAACPGVGGAESVSTLAEGWIDGNYMEAPIYFDHIHNVKVTMRNANSNPLEPEPVMGFGYTDDSVDFLKGGFFSFHVEGEDWFGDWPDPVLEFTTEHPWVETKDLSGPIPITYCWRSGVYWDLDVSRYSEFRMSIPGTECWGTDPDADPLERLELHSHMTTAAEAMRPNAMRTPGMEIPKVTVMYPSYLAWFAGKDFYWSLTNEIHIRDASDDGLSREPLDVIRSARYEYGKHLLHAFLEYPELNYNNGICDEGDGFCKYREEQPAVAWVEGFAAFLSLCFPEDQVDYNRYYHMKDAGYDYGCIFSGYNSLPSFTEDDSGPKADDNPAYVPGYVEGILNIVVRILSFSELWDLLVQYDPDPSDPDHDHIASLDELWSGVAARHPEVLNELSEWYFEWRQGYRGAADLRLAAFDWPVQGAAPGDRLPIELTIENVGAFQAEESVVHVYLRREGGRLPKGVEQEAIVRVDWTEPVPAIPAYSEDNPAGNSYTIQTELYIDPPSTYEEWPPECTQCDDPNCWYPPCSYCYPDGSSCTAESVPLYDLSGTYEVVVDLDASDDVYEGICQPQPCTNPEEDPEANNVGIVIGTLTIGEDYDNDGFISSQDCDDSNPRIRPSAEEICDGIDNNCDGQIDEGLPNSCGPIFVNAGATGLPADGSTWHRAYRTLQEALAAAVAGQEVWVAEGTYLPNAGLSVPPADPRSASFVLPGGVQVYGGFAGFEMVRAERDVRAHMTVLSGDLGLPGVSGDNAYHVVDTELHAPAGTVLDGFVIRDGLADGSGSAQDEGAGLRVQGSLTVANCLITKNRASWHGAGASVTNPWGVAPTFTNCIFLDNEAASDGGGLWLISGVVGNTTATLTNCVFNDNLAKNGAGGAVRIGEDTAVDVINTTLVGNQATIGGGLYAEGGGLYTVRNAIAWDNVAPTGAQMALSGAKANIDFSAFQGGDKDIALAGVTVLTWGANNVLDPITFADRAGADGVEGTLDDDLRLPKGTAGYDAGDAGSLPIDVADLDLDGNRTEPVPLDLDGRPRVRDDAVDLGAYEAGSTQYYVNVRATGKGTGLDWVNAFNHLQDALRLARAGDWVRVAAGVYKPDRGLGRSGGDRNATFLLKNGVSVVGGFAPGVLTSDPSRFPTLLSGDLAGDDGPASSNRDDNSYHVVTTSGADTTALLEGFIIRGGNAEPAYHPANKGGGLLNIGGSPRIRRCRFTDNRATHRGGGLWNGGSGAPALSECVFEGNVALEGGGMANETGHPVITHTTFVGNRASAGMGGGMFSRASSEPTVRNSTFLGNTARHGGALGADSSTVLEVENITFTANEAAGGDAALPSRGGAVYCTGGATLTARNCIFWDDAAPLGYGPEVAATDSAVTMRYSDVAAGEAGILLGGTASLDWDPGSFVSDPLFLDPLGADGQMGTGDEDLHLHPTSPAIDAGDPASDYSQEPNDPPGMNGGRINLGRYGNTAEAASITRPAGAILYVAANAPGRQTGLSWTDAFHSLQSALATARPGEQIWVADGTYAPDQGPMQTPGDRSASFHLRDGVAIYGGFPSGGGPWESRRPRRSGSVLTGDLRNNDWFLGYYTPHYEDNSHHVVTGSGTGPTAILDGFTIRGGHANPAELTYPATGGAGMYNLNGSPTVTNCWFWRNLAEGRGGGGMLNHDGSSPRISHCIFEGNKGGNGGAIYNAYGSSPEVSNTLFAGNTGNYGGAIELVYSSNMRMDNCTLVYNQTDTLGGGMRSYASNPVVTNSIFWNNTATSGNGPQIGLSSSTLQIAYTDLQGGLAQIAGPGVTAGEGVLEDVDPLPSGPEFALSAFSPCIDAGDPAAAFDNEPDHPEGRLNLGWYGNTAFAAMPDRDGDGVRDNLDAFPDDPVASLDGDGDGYPDTWNYAFWWFGQPRYYTAADSTTGLTLDVHPEDPLRWFHFTPPTGTPASAGFHGALTLDYGLTDASIGDELAVYDPDGVLCGHFLVTSPGAYGVVTVYGDDPATPGVDEGAEAGDPLRFRLWKASGGQDYPVVVDVVSGTDRWFAGDLNQVDLTAITAWLPTATLSGVPPGPHPAAELTLIVAGDGVVNYRYRLDGGEWSEAASVSQPLALTGLAAGEHTVEVVGGTDADVWQLTEYPTKAVWTVTFGYVNPIQVLLLSGE